MCWNDNQNPFDLWGPELERTAAKNAAFSAWVISMEEDEEDDDIYTIYVDPYAD